MGIGRPFHFRIPDKNYECSACGIINPYLSTRIAIDVECIRCRKTIKWKFALFGQSKRRQKNEH